MLSKAFWKKFEKEYLAPFGNDIEDRGTNLALVIHRRTRFDVLCKMYNYPAIMYVMVSDDEERVDAHVVVNKTGTAHVSYESYLSSMRRYKDLNPQKKVTWTVSEFQYEREIQSQEGVHTPF